MKKHILIASVILLLISCIFIYWYDKAHISEGDLIIEVNKDSIIETTEDNVLAYYEKNCNELKAVAEYLLSNEKVIGSRPVILNINNSEDIDKITDETIKQIVNRLFDEGIVKEISSLNDNVKNVYFLVENEYGVYTQGIRYTSNADIISKEKTKYNYVKEYTDIGNGWFYYLYFYNEIKGADTFRKIAWDKMSEEEKKSLTYDWNKAIVTLEAWDSVRIKKDNKDRQFVVSVYFNTNVDGLLGPIIVYLDPNTKEVVGGCVRM